MRSELKEVIRLLKEEYKQLNQWADESEWNGWSTHQVNPMRYRAQSLNRKLGEFIMFGVKTYRINGLFERLMREAKDLLENEVNQLDAWVKESVWHGWSTYQVKPMRIRAAQLRIEINKLIINNYGAFYGVIL